MNLSRIEIKGKIRQHWYAIALLETANFEERSGRRHDVWVGSG
jgi:hypothetical protein